MFERINYKNQAREQLKGKLKTPIIAFVVTMAITAMAAGLPQEGDYIGFCSLFHEAGSVHLLHCG